MANNIFKEILEEKINNFKYSFSSNSKVIFFNSELKRLIHAGEFGMYREAICKEYLRTIIPTRLDLGKGFIITDKGSISTQIDIIIYDKNNTPLVENNEKQRFFPIETVVGIVEVKSDLDKNEFKIAINKLAKNKRLREEMSNPIPIKREISGKFDPISFAYDNLFSILICNKLNFNLSTLANEIDSLYEKDIQQRHKHNLILSISDGLLAYYDFNKKTMMYPLIGGYNLKNRFLTPGENSSSHFYAASSYIFMGTSSTSIYYPEISDYLSDFSIGALCFEQNN